MADDERLAHAVVAYTREAIAAEVSALMDDLFLGGRTAGHRADEAVPLAEWIKKSGLQRDSDFARRLRPLLGRAALSPILDLFTALDGEADLPPDLTGMRLVVKGKHVAQVLHEVFMDEG